MNNRNIKPISPFILFCQKVIPLAFDESMSYYECLCALVNYLYNEVTPAVNNNADAVTELQNYVKNYFDNLDVQEEINNKLDEMAENGQLADIVAQYLDLACVLAYNNVSELKNAENVVNGSIAKTLGFHEYNDGGGAYYKIRQVLNTDNVNEMDLIALSDENLVAELISDKFNVMCYGVEKDDTNNNNHTLIQYVLDEYDYAYCKEEIELHNKLILTGQNKKFDFFKINYTPTTDSAIIIHDTINYQINGNHLISNSNGIRLGYTEITSGVQVNIGRITAEKSSIYLGGALGVLDSQFNVNRVEYKEHGIFLDLSQTYVGQLAFYNTVFNDNSSNTENYAVYGNCSSNRCTGLDFYNISMEGAKGGFKFETTDNLKFIEHLNVYGCRLAEFSINHNYKALKFVTPSSMNNIKIEGEFNFDEALASSFDLTEYSSIQSRGLKLSGLIRTSHPEYNNGSSYIGKSATLGYKKIIIDRLYKPYENYTPTQESTIYPLGDITLLFKGGSYTSPIYNIKLTDDNFVLKGIYKFYTRVSNTTINLINNDGSIAKTYSLATNKVLTIFATETHFSSDVQTLSNVSDEDLQSIT